MPVIDGLAMDASSKLRLLLVSNSEVLQNVIIEYCREIGFLPHLARNGDTAIQMHREGPPFDLILMDLEDAGQMALKELRKMGVNTFILGILMHDEHNKAEFLTAGFDEISSHRAHTHGILTSLYELLNEELNVRRNMWSCSKKWSVLIVDDDLNIHRMYQRLNCDSQVSRSGIEASDLCRRGESFDFSIINREDQFATTELQKLNLNPMRLQAEFSSKLSTLATQNLLCQDLRRQMSSCKKIRVLIVNGSSSRRMLQGFLCEKFDCVIQTASDGMEAREFFLRVPGESFDIILMGRRMPEMDGLTAIRELRKMGVNDLIVGVSHGDTHAEKSSFMEAGADDFCQERELMFVKLRNILHQPHMEATISKMTTSRKKNSVLVVGNQFIFRMCTRVGCDVTLVESMTAAMQLYEAGPMSFDIIFTNREICIIKDLMAILAVLQMMGDRTMTVGVCLGDGEAEKNSFMAAGVHRVCVQPLSLKALASMLQSVPEDFFFKPLSLNSYLSILQRIPRTNQ